MKSSYSFRIPAVADQVASVALLFIVFGLFFSRALLSISVGVFFLMAPFRLGLRGWLIGLLSDKLVWSLSLLWLLPLFSGFWSADIGAWMDVVRIKLPLLLIPMGWIGYEMDKRTRDAIGWLLTGLLFTTAIYSLIPWIIDSSSVRADYLRGKSLLTSLDNDRVRYSWLIVAAVWWLQAQWREADGRIRLLIAILLIFFALYLHVLAVRIGLVSFYLLAGFLLIRQLMHRNGRRWAFSLLAILVCLPFVFYCVLPTFRARVDYIRYDWSYTFQGKYLSGGNDAIRVQSLQVAGDVIRENPIYGVGFGDIRAAMDAAYHRVDPSLMQAERIYPANEWGVYGVGMGWVGLIFFSALMIGLFFLSSPDPFRWRSWVLITILSLVTDIGLEVQYGVVLIPFLLLFFRSADRLKNQEIRI